MASTHKQIEDILLYTQDARQKAKDGYFPECRESMIKAINIIDDM